MSRIFSFPVDRLRNSTGTSLVCFTAVNIDEEGILDQLRRYCETASPPDDILLICPATALGAAQLAISSDKFIDRLPAATRYVDEPGIEIVSFGVDGLLNADHPQIQKIANCGLKLLFDKHRGFIHGGTACHFIKPSGKHCNAFLRTANALVRGTEIDFIAACCLQYCPEQMTRIYTDTGAIHSVAYSILRLLQGFDDSRSSSVIDSFGSYGGLEDFQFEEPANSLVLVSASTSGHLVNDVIQVEPQFKKDQFLTLYYLGELAEGQLVLCDLRSASSDAMDNYELVVSFPAESCPLCRSSPAIPISDEHFIPQGIHVEPVLIAATDALGSASKFFERFAGHGIFKANYQDSESGSACSEVYLDLEELFKSDLCLGVQGLLERLNWLESHVVSADTKRIVHLADPASEALAKRLQQFAAANQIELSVLSANELQQDVTGNTQTGGTTIVVASAVSTGRRLVEVSTHLRHAQIGGAIKYAIGFARYESNSKASAMKSHLTFGTSGPSEHGYFVMEQFNFPTWRPERRTSWNEEEKLLASLMTLPDALEARKDTLLGSYDVTERGLLNNLFLPKITGERLELRPRFAFWNFDYSDNKLGEGRSISQADVYATIVSLLHNLRRDIGPEAIPATGGSSKSRTKGQNSLRQSNHTRNVISPRCFERFNDGIIQASILRASFPIEIDYSVSPELSEEMHSILETVFQHAGDTVGEAALEFLLAMAQAKLKLDRSAISTLYDRFHNLHDNEFWKFLWERIQVRSLSGTT